MDEVVNVEPKNIQNEILLVGSFYKNPDFYVTHGNYIRSKFDFDDEVTRFLYDCFELMYKTFSQTIDENKVNTFMSQDNDRLNTYKKCGGYKLIKQWIELADIDDFKNYFNIVKKYSLVREYQRNGYPVQKILSHKKFNEWQANDIYKMIRAKADKINTVICLNNESVVLNEKIQDTTKKYLIRPQFGIEIPWELINQSFRGLRLGKVIFDGLLSNEGKTRKLMKLIAFITLIKNEKFCLLSNEMDQEDLTSALITTTINNKEFKSLHGIDIVKPEKEIVLGQYRDNNGNFIVRTVDEWGDFVEGEDEFIDRVYKNSEEYRKVLEIGKWIESKQDKQIFFKDVGMDYSDQSLLFEINKHHIVHGVKYFGYDTVKGWNSDEWMGIKQTATKLKELSKEIKVGLYAVFQMTDDSVFTDIFELSSNNIANAKQMKHVVDHMLIGKRIAKDDYYKYMYVPNECWGNPTPQLLDSSKNYLATKIEKNRGGSKDKISLLEIDLNLNTWYEVGYLVKK
jgi:hypothetical protein